MKLSTKGQYAVMALADIAQQGGDDPVPLNDISDRQKLPLPYLEQLFTKLRRGGLVNSVRGNMGGYSLTGSPSHISILDIVKAVDETIRTKRCTNTSELSCHGRSERCMAHHLWDGLEEQIETYLSEVSLEDLCTQKLPTFIKVRG